MMLLFIDGCMSVTIAYWVRYMDGSKQKNFELQADVPRRQVESIITSMPEWSDHKYTAEERANWVLVSCNGIQPNLRAARSKAAEMSHIVAFHTSGQ